MAIQAADIKLFLSGGAANADPNASLGGAISSTEMPSGLHNLFDKVSGSEAQDGDAEYRCVYVKNTHGTLTLQGSVVWISSETPSSKTKIDIALDGAGVGDGSSTGVAETVGDEQTAPTGETFSHPITEGGGIVIGDLAPGEAQAIWVRRTIDPGAAAVSGDSGSLSVAGDSDP